MGWSIGYDWNWKRDIGYGVPAECDHPKCHERIDRGLSYVCGGAAFGGERGCGLYFCASHLFVGAKCPQLCARCANYKPPYRHPKPDVPEWTEHKATDPSWAAWRQENGSAERA